MEEETAIDRLKQFIDYQKISIRKFFIESGLSEGSFTKTKSIGSENLKRIVLRYPVINMDWVISGRGEMLLKDQLDKFISTGKEKEGQMIVGADGEAAQLAVQVLKDQITELQAKLIKCMEGKEKLVEGYLPSMNEPGRLPPWMKMSEDPNVGNWDTDEEGEGGVKV